MGQKAFRGRRVACIYGLSIERNQKSQRSYLFCNVRLLTRDAFVIHQNEGEIFWKKDLSAPALLMRLDLFFVKSCPTQHKELTLLFLPPSKSCSY